MTQRTRSAVEYLTIGVLAAAVSAGIAWGGMRSSIDALRTGKLDAKRFELDSAFRAGQQGEVVDAIRRLEAAQQETNNRLREIVCPPGARGCR